MTASFLEINVVSCLLEHSTYDPDTKVFKLLTEGVSVWDNVIFKCPENSEPFFFLKKHLLQPATRTNEEFKQNSREKSIDKFMTFELNLKFIWQHPIFGSHLGITKIVWGEVEKPFIITVRSLRQSQPGAWKLTIKQDAD